MSLAQRTLSGFVWTLISRMGTRVSILVVGIILARLLSPADFGLVAMLGIIFSISSSLVDSGFTQALIRKEHLTESDKSTAFSINIIVSLLLYIILWFSSPLIARFFNQPELLWLTRVMGLQIIFNALILVQRAVLHHSLKFKLLSAIDIGISIATGLIAIILAYIGMGVWSLAIKFFLTSLLGTIIFWILNPWYPKKFINKESFKYLFGFGSKLMLTGLITQIYNNIYNLVIGKVYSAEILGFYNRAYTFTNQTVASVVVSLQQVTYPILGKTQGNPEQLKEAYKKIVMSITFVNFPLSVILYFISEPLVLLLLGEKWVDTIPFMQILCIGILFSHIISMSSNVIKVIGRSDIILKVSFASKIIAAIAILIGLQFGIWGLITASIMVTYMETTIWLFIVAKHINYSISEQLRDIFSNAVLLIPIILIGLVIKYIDIDSNLINFILTPIMGGGAYIIAAWLSKSIAFNQITELLKPQYLKLTNKIKN